MALLGPVRKGVCSRENGTPFSSCRRCARKWRQSRRQVATESLVAYMTPPRAGSPRRLSRARWPLGWNAKLCREGGRFPPVLRWLMAELHRANVSGSGLYERLLQRLALALDEAETAERLRDEHPSELELRGLSGAEMELIRAYLDQN